MKPILFSGDMVRAILGGRKTQTRRVVKPQPEYNRIAFDMSLSKDSCPYGLQGDRLWVKEKWAILKDIVLPLTMPQPIHYMADIADRRQIEDYIIKPSIHMPRWASRITLEIVSVKIERLQDIREGDALKEGVRDSFDGKTVNRRRDNFISLWNSINAKRGFGWESNPWVWVIEFKQDKREHNEELHNENKEAL